MAWVFADLAGAFQRFNSLVASALSRCSRKPLPADRSSLSQKPLTTDQIGFRYGFDIPGSLEHWRRCRATSR